jgi:glycosyltransferase involved in cell wall biosynthesis
MIVSVVVPTRNSGRTLEACLSSIRAQTHPDVELVIVDNHSTDATREIAGRLGDRFATIGPERSAQRNHGALLATGSHLLFVDSDMVLDPGVVQECVELADGTDAVVIPEESFGEGFWARCKTLERRCYLGDDSIEAARFFSREIFERVGGYDEALVGPEDWDLHERVRAVGARLARTNAIIHHDEGRLRLRELIAKKYHYGPAMAPYAAKHPGLARSQFRLVRPAFIRNRHHLLGDPLTALGVVAMKSAEAAAGVAGLLRARL